MRNYAAPVRERAKQLVLSGLDRALVARGLDGAGVALARAEVIDGGRAALRAARGRRRVTGALEVVVTRPGHAELRPRPVVLAGPGEVTVELEASAISSGTERAQWLRLPTAQPVLPAVPGYAGAGRVLAVGGDVEGLAGGDRVAVLRARHASAVTVPAAWAVPVPAGVAVGEAALAYLAVIAGYGLRRAGPLAGLPLCVLGAGPIGALARRLAALQAPSEVTVVTRSGRGGARALADGTAGIGAAVVIEATGDPAAVAPAVAAARDGGTVVLLGSPRGVTPDAALGELQRRGIRLVGAHISALATEARRQGGDPFAGLARTYLEGIASGRVAAADLAGEAVDPREIVRFYRRLARGEAGAAHLEWEAIPRGERLGLGLRPRRRPAVTRAVPPPLPAGRPLRFAVIGCGDIGLANARAIAAAGNAEAVLCHDAVPALAEAAAEAAGAEAVPELEAALDARRVDAAFLSVPHDLHASLVARCAAAGLHVVVEKPLAVDLAGAEEAVAAAAAAGVTLSTCFSFRYYDAVRAARALADAGALGAFSGATVAFHADKPPSYWMGGFSGRAASDWRASRARAGGGVLIMNLTHYVDLIRHLTGTEPEWVAGTARTQPGAEVEDAIALSVGFTGGAVATISGSSSTRGAPPNRVELWGEDGTVRLEPTAEAYTERAVSGLPAGRWTPLPVEGVDETRRAFVEAFAAAVARGAEPDVTPADGLAVQRFVDAAYRAVASGDAVTLEGVAG
jgi:predicted dehydrogenase/NADPH:quinone reductase-like Zn-dependent oxidoreductase